MNPIFVATLLVIVACVCAFLYWMYCNCSVHKKAIEKMEDKVAATPAAAGTVLFISMDGCPYCDKFDPIWNDFSGTTSSVGWKAEKHTYYSKETADHKNDMVIKKYVTSDDAMVSSFPAVLFVTSTGAVTKYKGNRSLDDLTEELHTAAASAAAAK